MLDTTVACSSAQKLNDSNRGDARLDPSNVRQQQKQKNTKSLLRAYRTLGERARILDLNGCLELTYRRLDRVIKACPFLEEIDLRNTFSKDLRRFTVTGDLRAINVAALIPEGVRILLTDDLEITRKKGSAIDAARISFKHHRHHQVLPGGDCTSAPLNDALARQAKSRDRLGMTNHGPLIEGWIWSRVLPKYVPYCLTLPNLRVLQLGTLNHKQLKALTKVALPAIEELSLRDCRCLNDESPSVIGKWARIRNLTKLSLSLFPSLKPVGISDLLGEHEWKYLDFTECCFVRAEDVLSHLGKTNASNSLLRLDMRVSHPTPSSLGDQHPIKEVFSQLRILLIGNGRVPLFVDEEAQLPALQLKDWKKPEKKARTSYDESSDETHS